MTHRIVLLLACAILATAAHAQEVRAGKTVRVGGDIQVLEPVDGSLIAAGGRIRVEAPVTGNVRAAGGKIIIDAPIGGDVSVAGGSLELGPNARIAGKLKFRGGELIRDPASEVTGTVEHVSGRHHRELTTGERFLRGWIWTFGLILLAAIIAAALPGPSRRMAQELRERPWMTPLLGFVALTAIPVAAVLMMVTIIGIPLGLLALLGYAALLLVGYGDRRPDGVARGGRRGRDARAGGSRPHPGPRWPGHVRGSHRRRGHDRGGGLAQEASLCLGTGRGCVSLVSPRLQ